MRKAILLCKNLILKLFSSLKRFPEVILLAAATVSVLGSKVVFISTMLSMLSIITLPLMIYFIRH